jgi:isopentenyl phosphate kinase
MVTVLKLGGSVITDKTRRETLDGPALDAVADAIAAAYPGATPAADADVTTDGEAGSVDAAPIESLVLVHGGGSFGHPHADDHDVTTTAGTTDAAAVLEIHSAMKTLNQFVLARLHERAIPALPVHSLSAGHRTADGTLAHPLGQVRTMLGEGFVPVLHGDVIAHEGEGATVVSGDELVVRLAEDLDADRIGLCSTVPGVLDAEEAVIDRITSFEAVAGALGESDATDVSGGMAEKVRTLLELDAPADVFGVDDVGAFLAGERPGTRIDGSGGR